MDDGRHGDVAGRGQLCCVVEGSRNPEQRFLTPAEDAESPDESSSEALEIGSLSSSSSHSAVVHDDGTVVSVLTTTTSPAAASSTGPGGRRRRPRPELLHGLPRREEDRDEDDDDVDEGCLCEDEEVADDDQADEDETSSGPRQGQANVTLEPFAHQVGGRIPIVSLGTGTVCKPLNERELKFYRMVPEVLRPFIPSFEGVMQIEVVEDEDGFVTLTGLQPPAELCQKQRSWDSRRNSLLNAVLNRRLRLMLSQRGQAAADHAPSGAVSKMSRATRAIKGAGGSADLDEDEVFCNPWALKCHRDHLRKLGVLPPAAGVEDEAVSAAAATAAASSSGRRPAYYILLENIVGGYRRPCVMDLKVGARQYPDDVSAAKKRSKMVKAAQTTSSTLGLRLAGMQVYKRTVGKYDFYNKYHGRSLDEGGFVSAVAEFLASRASVRDVLLDKLGRLRRVMEGLGSFRFYTCSLLVSYDGDSDGSTAGGRTEDWADVRVIDFAHSTHQGMGDSVVHEGPDRDFLLGLDNLINILRDL